MSKKATSSPATPRVNQTNASLGGGRIRYTGTAVRPNRSYKVHKRPGNP